PEDILQDNSIQSAYLADANVKYNGRGIVGDIQRPGLLNKLFQFLF
ncbi:flagellar basal body L-ring protein FlgH, partial [bacterium]|nr:flagellar basal body L-ring protein FlgH [bacterium]